MNEDKNTIDYGSNEILEKKVGALKSSSDLGDYHINNVLENILSELKEVVKQLKKINN